eukprot:6191914-Pleurochrysis_carterae.AAC.2
MLNLFRQPSAFGCAHTHKVHAARAYALPSACVRESICAGTRTHIRHTMCTYGRTCACVCACVRVRVRVRARACARACVCACACVRERVHLRAWVPAKWRACVRSHQYFFPIRFEKCSRQPPFGSDRCSAREAACVRLTRISVCRGGDGAPRRRVLEGYVEYQEKHREREAAPKRGAKSEEFARLGRGAELSKSSGGR